MAIGKTIRYLRVARGFSQGKLANRIGVTSSYLSLIEHDKREPSLSVLKGIADCFDIPVEFLYLQQTPLNQLKPRQRKVLDQIRRSLLGYLLTRDSPSHGD